MVNKYKVGDIVNVKSGPFQCHAKPIKKVRDIFYIVEGLPYLARELEPTNEAWQPGMNVTAKSSHIAEGASSKIVNDFIKNMTEQ